MAGDTDVGCVGDCRSGPIRQKSIAFGNANDTPMAAVGLGRLLAEQGSAGRLNTHG